MATILIIDDDRMFRQMLKRLLEKEGYDVVEADEGKSGIQQFRNVFPDVVVCDLIMPDKEGIEAIQELQQINSDIPIIAVTGGGQIGPATYLILAQAMGARKTFSKPFVHKKFLNAVTACL